MKKHFLFAIIFLSLSCTILAQVPDNPVENIQSLLLLDTVRIKDYQEANSGTGQSFQIISEQEIEQKYFGQEPSFLLAKTPGFTVVSDAGSYSGYSYFRLRGIDQTRISMTWDGVPLNEPEDQGVYFSNYPDFFNSVRKVEVHRGVGVGSMGVASYGGSIHLFSQSMRGDSYVKFGGNYGSFGSWRAYEEMNRQIKKNVGLYVRGTVQHSDGYKDRSANTSGSALVSTVWTKGKHEVKFNGFGGQQANQMAWIGVPLDTLRRNPTFNANSQENDRFLQTHGQLHYTYRTNWGRVSGTVFGNYLDGNYDFDYNNFLGLPSTDEMYNYAFRSNWLGGMSNIYYFNGFFHLRGGVSASHYSRRHLGSEASFGELYQNTGIKDELSAYAKTEWRFYRWIFELDGQIRHAQLNYQGAVAWPGKTWLLPNGRAAVTWKPIRNNGNTVLYYSVGVSTREPARIDLFGGNDDLYADSLSLPIILDIVPETCLDHELGIRINGKKWSLNANLYAMQFQNEITLNGQFGPSGLPLHSNVAKTLRSGLEIDARWALPKGFDLTHASSFSYNRTQEGGESFEPILTPAVLINQGVNWTHNKLMLTANARYQSRAFLDFGNTAELPAFFTVDAGVMYALDHLKLSLRAQNLANAQYYGGGYIGLDGTPLYFIQAGANVMAGAEFNF